jgi:hypothetical protein
MAKSFRRRRKRFYGKINKQFFFRSPSASDEDKKENISPLHQPTSGAFTSFACRRIATACVHVARTLDRAFFDAACLWQGN